MKRYDTTWSRKRQDKTHFEEQRSGAFRCDHCHAVVVLNEYMGTLNRNHCNFCLWSKHVDIRKGDRQADCKAGMEPIGLTFKHEGWRRIGELMLVHYCHGCEKLSINRLAADDMVDEVYAIYHYSFALSEVLKDQLIQSGISLATDEDNQEIEIQLKGRME